MHKIAVIGDKNSVLGFSAVGLNVFAVETPEEAKAALHSAAGSEFAIIYITESVLKDIPEDVQMYQDSRIPAVIPIPGMDGSLGIGILGVRKSVERAVGADILFGNE